MGDKVKERKGERKKSFRKPMSSCSNLTNKVDKPLPLKRDDIFSHTKTKRSGKPEPILPILISSQIIPGKDELAAFEGLFELRFFGNGKYSTFIVHFPPCKSKILSNKVWIWACRVNIDPTCLWKTRPVPTIVFFIYLYAFELCGGGREMEQSAKTCGNWPSPRVFVGGRHPLKKVSEGFKEYLANTSKR